MTTSLRLVRCYRRSSCWKNHHVAPGRSLLLDALQHILRASDQLAVRAVTVEALDDRAASFYRRFGFEPSPLTPCTLMIPLDVARRTLHP